MKKSNSQGKKIPESVWKQFLELLPEHMGIVSHVARELGISRRNYYNKRLNDPDFALKADTLFDRVQVPIAEEMLRADVIERQAWAIRYTLDRSDRKYNQYLPQGILDIFESRIVNIEEKLRKKNKKQKEDESKIIYPPTDTHPVEVELKGEEEKIDEEPAY